MLAVAALLRGLSPRQRECVLSGTGWDRHTYPLRRRMMKEIKYVRIIAFLGTHMAISWVLSLLLAGKSEASILPDMSPIIVFIISMTGAMFLVAIASLLGFFDMKEK